jgi:Na+/H+ antiporter NhaD/arsenite permease-like protein
MNNFIQFIARLGIVRVLSVPLAMALVMYVLFRLAAPPEDLGDLDGETRRS